VLPATEGQARRCRTHRVHRLRYPGGRGGALSLLGEEAEGRTVEWAYCTKVAIVDSDDEVRPKPLRQSDDRGISAAEGKVGVMGN
jgi:hypothetical protein